MWQNACDREKNTQKSHERSKVLSAPSLAATRLPGFWARVEKAQEGGESKDGGGRANAFLSPQNLLRVLDAVCPAVSSSAAVLQRL